MYELNIYEFFIKQDPRTIKEVHMNGLKWEVKNIYGGLVDGTLDIHWYQITKLIDDH